MTSSNRSRTLKLLLATTAAISLGISSAALAQSAGSGAWVSVEGGLSALSTTSSYGYTDSIGFSGYYAYDIPGTGKNMAFEAGVDISGTPYSVSLGFRNSSNGSYYYYDGYSELEEGSFTTLDFEIGRDVSLGGIGDGRLTLGVRGASVNLSSSYDGWYSSYDSSNFTGAGPRVAFEASVPVHDRVSLDVEAGAAVLFGTTTDNYSYDGYSYPSTSSSEMVTNMDFSAALSYLIGSNSKVSLGYRYEQFSGLAMGYNGYIDAVTDQGAFVKFTTGF